MDRHLRQISHRCSLQDQNRLQKHRFKEKMRTVCPPELEFNSALDKCKDSVRKTRQRYKEKQAAKRATEVREVSRPLASNCINNNF